MLAHGFYLHDRYVIVRSIGQGGMGAVYEAIDARLGNSVAVKQMTLEGDEAGQAFEQEARLLAALRHPGLPVVIDYFTDATGHFLVMQYIDGEDLARVFERGGRSCAIEDVRRWAAAALDALSYLHDHSPPVVHRDIKPSNLMRTPRGEILLLDFGLAKGRPGSDATHTEQRSVFGYTLRYAPIEQIQGSRTDPRSDVYALGATLYHLATGIVPPTAVDRATAIGRGRPDPLIDAHRVRPDVGEVFSLALHGALAIEAHDRFRSAGEMRAALDGELAVAAPARPVASPDTPRRVDAAMPSHVELQRLADLIVQVRFFDSPFLGLEDWPTRRRPARVEQGSDAVALTFPVSEATGRRLPAQVHVKIVAPDFSVSGRDEQLVEVPPDDYSKRLVFLMTAHRPGASRVNVEIREPGGVFLGVVALEPEIVAALPEQVEYAVANLTVAAREMGAPTPPMPGRAAPVPPPGDVAPLIQPLSAAPVRIEQAGSAVSVPPQAPQPYAAPAAAGAAAHGHDAPAAPASRGVPRVAIISAAAGIVLVAGLGFQMFSSRSAESAPTAVVALNPPAPVTSPPPADSVPAAPAPAASAPPPPTRAASPARSAPPAPTPSAPVPAPPRDAAVALPPPPPPPPPLSTPPPPPAMTLPPEPQWIASVSHPGLAIAASSATRSDERVTVRVRIRNRSASGTTVAFDLARSHVRRSGGQEVPVFHPAGTSRSASWDLAPAGEVAFPLEFVLPRDASGALDLVLAAIGDSAPRFPPVRFEVR